MDSDALNEFADYWEQVRTIYAPFDTSPRTGSAEVYFHEMPGGQFTNLKEHTASMGLSSRWPEIARCYAEVNELFGDIQGTCRANGRMAKKTRGNRSWKIQTHQATDADLYNHLIYPDVFVDFSKFEREYGDVSKLPTPAFFYGLKPGEEIAVDIEQGKTLFVKLINVGSPAKDGRRVVAFEFNGIPREATTLDRSLSVGVGAKVAKGDKILTLEAMKMQTTLYAPADGVIDEILAQAGEAVDTGDLIVRLRA